MTEATASSTKPLLAVNHLSKTYRLGEVQVRALRDVSLEIARGSMVCIMGKSGSGKSTLLRQLGLIDTPDDGDIVLDGIEVTHLGERDRGELRLARLGYVFQEYALLGELTAQENVFLPAMMVGRSGVDYRARALELLERVGLGERARHRPRELSGGEQQRVAIARALINEPAVVYADEPTANLDSASASVVMQTLQELNRELAVTVLFVSHDPDDRAYASELLFLRDGELASETA
jgi:putative ABC transport system ATP-binding protein